MAIPFTQCLSVIGFIPVNASYSAASRFGLYVQIYVPSSDVSELWLFLTLGDDVHILALLRYGSE